MNWDALLFIFSLLDGAALLFLSVYFIITLSDLECDYINATQCCRRLNVWIIPEIIAHGFIVASLLSSFHWLLFLLNAPLTVWQVYRFLSMPTGNIGIYDPTEIHNRQQLKSHMKESMIKLAFHLIFFFIYLYCMIVALITGSDSGATS